MTEENKENCNFQQTYNVFGLDDKPCCYLYHKYCEEINNCYFKRCKRLEQENKELRQQYNCYACDTCQGKEDYRNMKRHCENAIKTVHAYRSALEKIKDLCIHYENTNDKCVINCYAHFIVTDLIQNKINEVLQ